jgi:hypothetical protein
LIRFALIATVAFALPACAANLVSRPPATIVIQNGAGFLLHTSQGSPYQTTGDVFTASEGGYSGSFSAKVATWNHQLTPSPCYTVTSKGPATFAVTTNAGLCFSGDVEGLQFADGSGLTTIIYLTP